jgi:hypothetical protein
MALLHRLKIGSTTTISKPAATKIIQEFYIIKITNNILDQGSGKIKRSMTGHKSLTKILLKKRS